MNNRVVYRHIKPCGETFYIGIGIPSRPYETRRSDLWHRVVDKYGYEVEILKYNMSLKEAKELEVDLISWYGRIDLGTGPLVNHTSGGEGVTGYVHTKESKAKISKSLKGNTRALGHIQSDETKAKISKAQMGKKHTLKRNEAIGAKLRKEVHQYSLEGKYIQSFESAKFAVESLGKSGASDIGKCCRGKSSKAYGYKWSYEKL